ncbi:MAG: hypothetical protein IKB38_07970 [Clostridia bacterium]|nr:hypothetical protein [Clostridia bacterium]
MAEAALPIYWHGSVELVNEGIKKVKRGTVKELLPSAGGRPIYMVEYGKSNLPPRKANLSSALGGKDFNCYADKRGADYVPTVYFAGCIHGGEFEGTVAIMNLISLLETGVDLAGNKNDKLLSAAEKVHLILTPMCNPDGRSHIPFDNFVGHTFYDLRYYNQGIWKNGELCGWPECKQVHPIKDHVAYLGGYFNDDGVNMMHDNFFGHNANETQNVLDVCAEYAPDVAVLCHGGSNCPPLFTNLEYASGNSKREMIEMAKYIRPKYEAAGLVGFEKLGAGLESRAGEDAETPASFNLISAMHHCCGAPCITFESNQGLCDHGKLIFNNDQIYLSHMLMMEALCEWASDKYAK